MGNTKSTKKQTGKKAQARNVQAWTEPRTYTQAELDAELQEMAQEYSDEIDRIVQRRYALELASRQIEKEMEYSGNGAPKAGDFNVYIARAEEIIGYMRNGVVASVDGD